MQKALQTSSTDQQNDPNSQQTSTNAGASWQGSLRQRKWNCVRLDVHRRLCLHLRPSRLLTAPSVGAVTPRGPLQDFTIWNIMQPLVWAAFLQDKALTCVDTRHTNVNQDQYMFQTNPNIERQCDPKHFWVRTGCRHLRGSRNILPGIYLRCATQTARGSPPNVTHIRCP